MTDQRKLWRESWSLLRLFAAGVAWGAPLITIGFANTNPGIAAHPQLARWLEPLAAFSPLLVPALAASGVVVLARLSRHRLRPNTRSVLLFAALGGLPLLLGLLESMLSPFLALLFFEAGEPDDSWLVTGTGLIMMLPMLLAAFEILIAVVAGVGVTVATLWRWRPWLAPLWLTAWLLAVAVVWLVGRPAAEGGDDLGGGLMAGVLGFPLLAAPLLATLIVAWVQARQERLSRQVETTGT